jgi:5-methylcytosine-specific restriction endonuclease McrA
VEHYQGKHSAEFYRSYSSNRPLPAKEDRRAKRLESRLRRRKRRADKKRRQAKQVATPAPPPRGIPYASYLESEWWKFKRRQKLDSVKGVCERCGRKATQVHHKHYKTLGRENNVDLEAVCGDCHQREHEGLIQARNHLDSIQRQK